MNTGKNKRREKKKSEQKPMSKSVKLAKIKCLRYMVFISYLVASILWRIFNLSYTEATMLAQTDLVNPTIFSSLILWYYKIHLHQIIVGQVPLPALRAVDHYRAHFCSPLSIHSPSLSEVWSLKRPQGAQIFSYFSFLPIILAGSWSSR